MEKTSFETEDEYTQDLLLSLGSGKVITIFFFLITITSIIRSIWFMIPSTLLEGTYTPKPILAYETNEWKGVLISEIMLALGSLGLYGIFLLVICYWAHMLHKVENPEIIETSYLLSTNNSTASSSSSSANSSSSSIRRGPMETFGFMMLFLIGAEILNIILFLLRVYNSEVMILYDSLLFSLSSLATLIAISIFSNRIRIVLTMMGVINGNSTKPQVRRILAITVAANIFFIIRLVIELLISLYLITLWTSHKSFYVAITDQYWKNYIFCKHWSEICVLALELLISTATKSSTTISNNGNTNSNSNTNNEDKISKRLKKKKYPPRRSNESELLPLRGGDFDGDEVSYRGIAV